MKLLITKLLIKKLLITKLLIMKLLITKPMITKLLITKLMCVVTSRTSAAVEGALGVEAGNRRGARWPG